MRVLLALFVLMVSAAIGPVNAQRSFSPPPELKESEKKYVSTSHTVTFKGGIKAVRRSLNSREGGVLAFTEPTRNIPGIERFEPLQGSFPNEGAVRRVFLTDGNQVVERVLRNDAQAFEYQIWDFTARNAWALDHIYGRFEYTPINQNETQVTWTYSVAPSTIIARPAVRGFLRRDFGPFLRTGLDGAAEYFNQRN